MLRPEPKRRRPPFRAALGVSVGRTEGQQIDSLTVGSFVVQAWLLGQPPRRHAAADASRTPGLTPADLGCVSRTVRERQPGSGSTLTVRRHPSARPLAVAASARLAAGFSSPSGTSEEDPAPDPQPSLAARKEPEPVACDCCCRSGLRRLRFFTCEDAGEFCLQEGVHRGPFVVGGTRCKD
jgi:hypothetical protein